jgi:hypothetical protein
MGYATVAAILLLLLVLSALRKRRPISIVIEKSGPVMNELDIIDQRITPKAVAPTIVSPPAMSHAELVDLENDQLHDPQNSENDVCVPEHPIMEHGSKQTPDQTDEQTP